MCLYGMRNISGTALFVRRMSSPVRELVVERNRVSIECERTEDFLGFVHTHPNGDGEPSKTDLDQLQQVDLIVVVCGPGCRTSWLSGHVRPIERLP